MTANTTFDRSDKIRQRRNQRSQERVVRATNVVHTPRVTRNPTVTVRGSGMGQSILNRSTTQPRRKYYVALDAAGAELAMPALPMIRPGWRLLSGLIIIAMVVLLIVVSTASIFQVKAAKITGIQRLAQADLEAVLDLKGTSIVMVDPNVLRTKLEDAFPELSGVAVNVSLPASVNVSVREREPVMAWKIKDSVIWIDSEGVRFNPHGDAEGLVTIQSDDQPPLIQTAAATLADTSATAPADTASAAATAGTASTAGAKVVQNPSSQRVDMKILKAAILLGSQMPDKSVLVYNYLSGLGWTDPRGWKVYFGLNLDDIAPKFIMYETIVDQLTQKKITPAVISVENIDAPFYRLEQ